MSEFSGSIDCFVDRDRVFINQNDQSAIVIHGTGGSANQTAEQLGAFFASTSEMTCVHYGIDRIGTIAQYCLEQDGACGNGILDPGYDAFWNQFPGNPNTHTLSVETVNDSANSLPLSDPQKQTLFKLIAYWVKKYKIPLSNIKGHFSLQPINRSHCPGPNFPWQELFNYLNGGDQPMTIDLSNPTVASHFSGTDNILWTCKDNGFVIGHAILDFYRSFGGNALCGLTHLGLPKSNELPVHGLPVVVEQEFERATVRYDPSHLKDNPPGSGSVYLIHEDQDARWIAQLGKIGTLQDENDKLKALLASSNLGQISTLGKQIADDVSLIMKLVSVQ